MAAIPVTIVGQDGNGNPITIIGMMSLTGVGVGGGPIMPTPPTGPPVYPVHPIAPNYPPGNYPSLPIYWPGYPPGWGTPPIVQPPPGGGGGDGGPTTPPIDWQIAWSPDTGWIVVGIPQFPHPAPSDKPAAT